MLDRGGGHPRPRRADRRGAGLIGAGRRVAAALPALALFAGCLDELLEAPYVLAAGLGEARSLTPGLDGRLLVATATGTWAVTAEGVAARVGDPALAVATHPGVPYRLAGGRVAAGAAALETPGAVDVLAGYEALLVAYPDRLALHALDGALLRTVPLGGVRAVALGPDDTYLVVTATSLLSVDAAGLAVTELVGGLVDARAAAADARGRVHVAHGAPTELGRLDPGPTLTTVARWLGDARDLQFGVGPFPVENLYIANGDGTLDYLRPP